MPELPDLTVFAGNLASRLNGKKVQSVESNFTEKRLNVSPEALKAALVGATVEDVQRSGKEILFQFSNNSALLVHLMLSGGFTITQSPDVIKYKALAICFDDGVTLVVSDPKAMATAKLNHPPTTVPDALDVDLNYLRAKISKRPKMLAKVFLTDQSIVRGIGNAYVDEILWEARISPKSVIGKVPDAAIEALFSSIRTVLIDAIDQIRKINPDIISGEVRDFPEDTQLSPPAESKPDGQLLKSKLHPELRITRMSRCSTFSNWRLYSMLRRLLQWATREESLEPEGLNQPGDWSARIKPGLRY